MKNYLKLTLCSLLIAFTFFACENDSIETVETLNENDSTFSVKIIGQNEVKSNDFVKTQLTKFKQESSSNFLNRDVYNAEYDFTVNTD